MIDYLFDQTDINMTLPRVVNKERKVDITNEQSKTITYKVYEKEPVYNSIGNYFHLVDAPSSKEEEKKLFTEVFNPRPFTEKEKKELILKDILIIETLKSYTVI